MIVYILHSFFQNAKYIPTICKSSIVPYVYGIIYVYIMYVWMDEWVYVCMCVCMYACMYVHACLYVYVCEGEFFVTRNKVSPNRCLPKRVITY